MRYTRKLIFSDLFGPVPSKHGDDVRRILKAIDAAAEEPVTKSIAKRGFELIDELSLEVESNDTGYKWQETPNGDQFFYWFYGDGGIKVHNILRVIQHILKTTKCKAYHSCEWSELPRGSRGFLGGGAAIITPQKIDVMTTHRWLQDKIATLENGQRKKSKKRR